MKTVFNAKLNFDATIGESKETHRRYVLLNLSKYCGKNQDGSGIFEKYHLTVWGQYDILKAAALCKGDEISFVLANEKPLVDKGGYPFIQGYVVDGMLSVCLTETPSESVKNFFAEQGKERDRRREERKTRSNSTAPEQATSPKATMIGSNATPVTTSQMNGIEIPF